ncbi:MAG: undecaprenyl/decaprenyl-phosphate alpha-N-acetylglucosaminyl 1-phosphate transferase [Planctomycetes bacterium]|nr:undecaprenyl/decaprenyl-phosphate alpha-N-acetylglucosaminyl 1-phosphate transferase [Planctomycetota bacterium]
MIVLAVGVPCLLAVVATWGVRSLALRFGFVDHPGGHKRHDSPVALGGGIAIVLAVVLPLLVGALLAAIYGRQEPPEWLPELLRTHLEGVAARTPRLMVILGGVLGLHLVGLFDDRRPLKPGVKFLAQLLAAGAAVFGANVRLLEMLPAPISIGLTVLWIVLITNAFNFLDNMDGLSAGVAVIAAAIFAAAAMRAGQLFVPVVALVLVGVLLGFLAYNFAPASIYMGDAGSMVIGYLLAVLTVQTTFYDPRQDLQPFGVLVPLVVLAVPLYDVASVCWHRHRAGTSIFRGDQRHFSHRLVQRGMSVRAAVLTIYLATAVTAMSALILPRASWPIAGVVFAQCIFMVLMIALLEHLGTRNGVQSSE